MGPITTLLSRATPLLLLFDHADAMDNGLVRTPPLGWMSWMYYETDVSEAIIKGVADEMVRTSLSTQELSADVVPLAVKCRSRGATVMLATGVAAMLPPSSPSLCTAS